jgi:Trp operon repressor
MKIKKNGEVINLTESEIREVVKQYKIKRFLSEDRESRKVDDKKMKVGSIITKMTILSNMLKTTDTNLESISTLNKIEEFLEKTIEDLEDKIENKHSKEVVKDLK